MIRKPSLLQSVVQTTVQENQKKLFSFFQSKKEKNAWNKKMMSSTNPQRFNKKDYVKEKCV